VFREDVAFFGEMLEVVGDLGSHHTAAESADAVAPGRQISEGAPLGQGLLSFDALVPSTAAPAGRSTRPEGWRSSAWKCAGSASRK